MSSLQVNVGLVPPSYWLKEQRHTEKKPQHYHYKHQVLTCHYQLHGEVLVQAIFCIAQDNGVVPSMLWSHISYAQPVLRWVRLVASLVILDQFAIFVPVVKGPARLIMCTRGC